MTRKVVLRLNGWFSEIVTIQQGGEWVGCASHLYYGARSIYALLPIILYGWPVHPEASGPSLELGRG